MATNRWSSIGKGVLVVCVSVCLYLALQSVLAATSTANFSNTARVELANSLIGIHVTLPKIDEFQRQIPTKSERTIVVLGGCNSCTLTSDGELKIPLQLGPTIYLTPDKANISRIGPGKTKYQNWVIVDANRSAVPALAYDLAPTIISIDGGGKIINVRLWP